MSWVYNASKQLKSFSAPWSTKSRISLSTFVKQLQCLLMQWPLLQLNQWINQSKVTWVLTLIHKQGEFNPNFLSILLSIFEWIHICMNSYFKWNHLWHDSTFKWIHLISEFVIIIEFICTWIHIYMNSFTHSLVSNICFQITVTHWWN